MGQPYKSSVEHVEFAGMTSNVDKHDIPAGGAQMQVNINIVQPGTLRVRGGLREVTFDTED
jgi:hypothetical protein